MAKRKSRSEIRKKRSRYSRSQNNRELRKVFLLVCEGGKTEPNYFSAFRVPKDICEIRGVGYNTRSLVEKAVSLSKKGSYDTWEPRSIFNACARNKFPANGSSHL